MKVCFYCTNFHQLEPGKECECACHIVAPIFEKMQSINGELSWTIPQLVAIKKLIEETAELADAWADAGGHVGTVGEHIRALVGGQP